MLLLVTKAVPSLNRLRTPHLGRLVTPRHYTNMRGMAAEGYTWAADNDAFNGFSEERYITMLDAIKEIDGCQFVVAPDVVADAAATLALFDQWHDPIRMRGLPVALAAQDGLDRDEVPWTELDALFIGGTDDFKLGLGGARLVTAAREHGVWVHVGRVNSAKRIRYAHSLGADSVDGSGYSRFYDTHVPTALALLEELDAPAPVRT